MEKYVKRGKEEGERQILSARLIEKHAEAGGRGKQDYDIG